MRLRGLGKLPDGRGWLWGRLGLDLLGRAMLSKSLIQFLLKGGALFPPCCLAWSQAVDPNLLGDSGTLSGASLAPSPTGFQSQILWGFSVPLLDPQVGKSVVDPRTFLTVWEFLRYDFLQFVGHLLLSPWLALIQEGFCDTLGDSGLLQPEPLSPPQVTPDPCLRRRHSHTQRQVWLSLCEASLSRCTQGFVWALWVSLVGMGFDPKRDFAPPTLLLGFFFCPWTWGIFFW